MKSTIVAFGLIGIVTGSYFGSTKLGLRTEGWEVVRFEVPGKPSFAAVGQNLYDSDGTHFIVTSISRNRSGDHMVEARVRVTHRLALDLFPTRMEKSYAMNRKAIERAVLQAAGAAGVPFEPSQKEWIAAN